jgi:UDP-N-acetylmuramyl pentapeptide synthase
MRTYVRMIFSSEGASPQTVLGAMHELGFEESMGMHDFVYRWKDKASFDEVIGLVGRMHDRMKGLHVNYEITTIS